MKKPWPKALFLGILASVFFSVTYVVNAAMAQSGGNWMWSASLRYLLLLPMLLVLTAKQGWTPVKQYVYNDGTVCGMVLTAPERAITIRNTEKKQMSEKQLCNLTSDDDE